jgi:hypothetical protein
MAIAQIGILYATDTKVWFGWVVPDEDAQLDTAKFEGTDGRLTLLKYPAGKPRDRASQEAAIFAATGVQPPDGRCVQIDKDGTVIAVTRGCPIASAMPELIPHAEAIPGDRWDGTQFLRKQAIIDKQSRTVEAISELPIDAQPTLGANETAAPLAALPVSKVGDVLPAKTVPVAQSDTIA